nr:immunoglobulin light chain junction region [Macaca mulatta]MOX56402.1 immunoglobulin light chain junction region [Macaca mulatta]
CLQYDSSPLTF